MEQNTQPNYSAIELSPESSAEFAKGELYTLQYAEVIVLFRWTDGVIGWAVKSADGSLGAEVCANQSPIFSNVQDCGAWLYEACKHL